MEKEKTKINFVKLGKEIIIFLVIIGLGMFAINQTLGYFYKSAFLQKPCGLCVKLNPEVKECMFKVQSSFPDGMGGWSDPNKKNNYTMMLNLTT